MGRGRNMAFVLELVLEDNAKPRAGTISTLDAATRTFIRVLNPVALLK